MILEFLLAWATEVHTVLCILAWAGVLAITLAGASYIVLGADKDEWAKAAPRFKRVTLVSLVFITLTTIPTIDSLWKMRVGLLKLELASPENMKAVGGHIEEIVKALECKHLGVNCPKESK